MGFHIGQLQYFLILTIPNNAVGDNKRLRHMQLHSFYHWQNDRIILPTIDLQISEVNYE